MRPICARNSATSCSRSSSTRASPSEAEGPLLHRRRGRRIVAKRSPPPSARLRLRYRRGDGGYPGAGGRPTGTRSRPGRRGEPRLPMGSLPRSRHCCRQARSSTAAPESPIGCLTCPAVPPPPRSCRRCRRRKTWVTCSSPLCRSPASVAWTRSPPSGRPSRRRRHDPRGGTVMGPFAVRGINSEPDHRVPPARRANSRRSARGGPRGRHLPRGPPFRRPAHWRE